MTRSGYAVAAVGLALLVAMLTVPWLTLVVGWGAVIVLAALMVCYLIILTGAFMIATVQNVIVYSPVILVLLGLWWIHA